MQQPGSGSWLHSLARANRRTEGRICRPNADRADLARIRDHDRRFRPYGGGLAQSAAETAAAQALLSAVCEHLQAARAFGRAHFLGSFVPASRLGEVGDDAEDAAVGENDGIIG